MSQDVVNTLNSASDNNTVADMLGKIYALPKSQHTSENILAILSQYSFGREWEDNVNELNNIAAGKSPNVSNESDKEAAIASNNQNKFVNDPKFSTSSERAKGSTSKPGQDETATTSH